MARPRKKNIWEGKISAHITLREDTNLVIVELAKDLNISKGEVVERAIVDADMFRKKMEELKEKGFFT
ncbi:hypothetical protein [Nitratifractor salsuginis]|uniref:Uncharacterized protein n=1 Tax=Nitratifractor salsuginis (strain DSM 16511 / JCM 12458 / E9I37-1) TaxID=749222 RepID=E6X1P7_NITSE|nr:hypothetical protein [Nitratifractor salsuginis]ADV47038.1 hypothetical protein Nitsa_1793 [Nitratifractor salsuginis DSM 16511]